MLLFVIVGPSIIIDIGLTPLSYKKVLSETPKWGSGAAHTLDMVSIPQTRASIIISGINSATTYDTRTRLKTKTKDMPFNEGLAWVISL